MSKDKGAAGGAVRKTGDGAKAPASSAPETPVVETPVVETPVVETPVVETPVVETPSRDPEAEKKAKEAGRARDRRIKEKKKKEETEAAEAIAAKRRGYYIKPGLAITSNKGIVAGAPKGSDVWEGDKVTLEHFSEEVGARLCESGAIVEVK